MNALINETSPYLLQHAHNPVDWHPWGDEALAKARAEDKPILLSVGYSACHWCHVMERESFENEAIARLMNQNFVNIKVDREERPDLDAIYMGAVQLMTGQGGWPMTVFLTPDQVPFYGGTYFPPDDRYGRPGFPRVLLSVARAYRERRDDIFRDSARIVEELNRIQAVAALRSSLSVELIDTAARTLVAQFDSTWGGLGGAPKFPPSMALTFLLRCHSRTGDPRYLEAVESTLRHMAAGGMYDQLGGGFHRYSVDAYWLVPHFEKMLYDNALLSRIYLDAWLVTGDSTYRRVTEETIDYVLREMTSPEGGFYSSQDADSEGHEGKFFVWTPAEVTEALGEEDGRLFCRYFDVSESGNFEGQNVLHTGRTLENVARMDGVRPERVAEAVVRGRQILFEVRERRVKPARDEKILTAWNGMMLRSMAEAARGLDRGDYRRAAERCASFLMEKLFSNGRLLRTYKDGAARYPAYLEDYACLADGLLALYETTFDLRWFDAARQLARSIAELFRDPSGSGFFFTAADHEKLIQRPRDAYDNATPSGNSVAVDVFLRLAELTGDAEWRTWAEEVLESTSATAAKHPSAFAHLLCALDFALAKRLELAVAGDPGEEECRVLLREIRRRYLPNKVVACGPAGSVPLLEGRPMPEGRPAVYVCEDFVCGPPVSDPAALAARLAPRSSGTHQ